MALPTSPDPSASGLTPQEILFCAEYVKDNNATRAYEVAFPYGRGKRAAKLKKKMTPKAIGVSATRLMAVPAIKSHINALVKASMVNAVNYSHDTVALMQRVIEELIAIATFDEEKFMTFTVDGLGRKRPTVDWEAVMADPIARKAIDFEVATVPDGEGGVVEVYRFRKLNKMQALDKLMKYGMIAQGQVTGFGGGDVNNQMVINVNFPVPGSLRSNTKTVDADFTAEDSD